MAQTDTYGTQITNIMYEDLIDVVTNIDPIDTYVLSNTPNARAGQRYHEWTLDNLISTQTAGTAEGATFTATSVTGAARTGNYCQITRQQWALTDTLLATETVGGDQEAYQMQRHMKSLSRDIEYALLINSGSPASASSASARVSAGMRAWITDNKVTAATGSTSAALGETVMNNALQECWADGGKPSVALLGGYQKRAFSGLGTQTRERGLAGSVAEVQFAVDIYKSDFGPIMLKLHHHMQDYADSEIVILGDMSLWATAWLRPITSYEIARTGGARNFMVEAEYTLESRAEKGSAKITNLTSS